MENDADSEFLLIGGFSSDEEETALSKKATKEDRTRQTEAEFQAQKASWKPKIETGDIWKTLELPLRDSASKPEKETVLHAIEELYFFRDYAKAVEVADRALSGPAIDDVFRADLTSYRERCMKRLEAARNVS
ncbi:MAG: hypothetical protein M1819_007048 [Sarea resinae]|nr:MAG: hypothetical protein M1819_007048 [Sarea resinae]